LQHSASRAKVTPSPTEWFQHNTRIHSVDTRVGTRHTHTHTHTHMKSDVLGKGVGGGKHPLEVCEGGVGLERLCKGYPSLSTKAVVVETAREGR